MLELPQKKELAILVHINFPSNQGQNDLAEFIELVISAGAQPVYTITATREVPDVKYYIGSGKAEEIKQAVAAHNASLIIVNHQLSPAQERNLERLCQCRVLNRSGLILDIFAQRARTFEGKLQVELAQLTHLSTRLVRGWTHLERQRGGIGLRGPGETQLETDRRLVKARMDTIKKRLEKVRQQRAQNRRARQRQAIPVISLVGYTNAGKSTLFNALTNAGVYQANQLFATLDPTLRSTQLPYNQNVILADTVGFIRHLPHELIAAFRATLEETLAADLLLHVIDASHSEKHIQIEQVYAVLKEIGADQIPLIEVYNKIDQVPDATPFLEYDQTEYPKRIWLSAKTGQGIEILKQALSKIITPKRSEVIIRLTPEQSKMRSQCYDNKIVLSETLDETGDYFLTVSLSKEEQATFQDFIVKES
ncbi:MAG: GTPase HflX [Legionellaceae bacterium]